MQPSEILAVVRLSGQPSVAGCAHGEAAIREAIAGSAWVGTSPPMIRLHEPFRVLPWGAWYEVAVCIAAAATMQGP
jgi:hypothetical protein